MNKFKSWIIHKLGGYTAPPRAVTLAAEVTFDRDTRSCFGGDFVRSRCIRETQRKLLETGAIDRFIERKFWTDARGDTHCHAKLSVVDVSEVGDYHVGIERTV